MGVFGNRRVWQSNGRVWQSNGRVWPVAPAAETLLDRRTLPVLNGSHLSYVAEEAEPG